MLYITTRYGLFTHDPETGESEHVLTNQDTSSFWTLPSKGIFGIDRHSDSGDLILASRETRRFPWTGRYSRTKKLHALDPKNHEHREIDTLRGVYDVHQIEVEGDRVFITDAVENRVLVYDLCEEEITKVLNLGPEREDLHHVNTVLVRNGTFYLGLNTSPEGSSKILSIPYEQVINTDETEFDLLERAFLRTNEGVEDTHDLVPYDGTFLISASEDGYVFRADTQEKVLEVTDWTRGICVTDDGIWVGSSEKQKNSEKRERKSDGKIYFFEKDFESPDQEIVLNESGQVYDIVELNEN